MQVLFCYTPVCDYAFNDFVHFIAAIDVAIELDVHTSDEMYLNHLRSKLPSALERFKPDMVVYNAGRSVGVRSLLLRVYDYDYFL